MLRTNYSLKDLQTDLAQSSAQVSAAYAAAVAGIKALYLNEESDVMNPIVVSRFLKDIALHHANTNYPYHKEKFEVTLYKALTEAGLAANMPESKNNPCFDMRIGEDFRISCKTEASMSISEKRIKISKWKELNKWEDDRQEPVQAREDFFKDVDSLDKVYMLRCLHPKDTHGHVSFNRKIYQLYEVPVAVVQSLKEAEFSVKKSQKTFYLEKTHAFGAMVQAQFSGGGEKKLTVAVDTSLCVLHMSFAIDIPDENTSVHRAKIPTITLVSSNAAGVSNQLNQLTPAFVQDSLF